MAELVDDAGYLLSPAGSKLFGKYELGKQLGCGAFAKVYHARNLRTGQSVAIKAVSKQKVFKGGLTAHIEREISIMRQLRHPNIARLHEVLATKTKIYFVMEFAKGGELFAKVAKGRFSEDLSRRYFQQLIAAVGYCHSRGVFHRDLKPENLLLDENWDLKLTDFGLSAVTGQIRPDGLLHTLCGTPAYVAPEILRKKGYDGAKVDIWSCGIILYVLNAGYLPFNDPNLMVMYRKIYKGEFRCPKWTSPELNRFLCRLLDTNPETRITVDEMTNDPWFKQDYKELQFQQVDHDFELKDCANGDKKYLNAFDIISLSSGVDLSGLFNFPGGSVSGERFISADSPERIIERIKEVVKGEGLKVVRQKILGVGLEGRSGDFVGVVEIHRLTEKLVMVDIRRREGGVCVGVAPGREIWKDKVRPQLSGLVYQPEREVGGS
ncbi:unnamed protein product [Ilex paraguariensis]|uniref:non-specific serine/threonine protein kinase n=1 Tax=Ilex paraguariensis TaxID=185542 RepID=A0ABC8SFC3_9AQUA